MAIINGKKVIFSPTITIIEQDEEEAYNKGFADGYEQGKAEGEALPDAEGVPF